MIDPAPALQRGANLILERSTRGKRLRRSRGDTHLLPAATQAAQRGLDLRKAIARSYGWFDGRGCFGSCGCFRGGGCCGS